MVYIVMAYVFMAYRVLATQGGLKRAKKRDWYIAGTKQRLGPMVRKMCITPEQLYFNLTKYQDHYPPDIEQCVFFFCGDPHSANSRTPRWIDRYDRVVVSQTVMMAAALSVHTRVFCVCARALR